MWYATLLKVTATLVLAAAWFHAAGWWGQGIHRASASQASSRFCEIREAGEVLKRGGRQTPAGGVLLVADQDAVRPGKSIQARMLNFGPRTVRFGAEFKIQRYGLGGWRTDPSSPDGPWNRRAGILRPGRAGGCYKFLVPRGQESGQYRFLTMVTIGLRKEARISRFRVGS